jgi:hypothetical protein
MKLETDGCREDRSRHLALEPREDLRRRLSRRDQGLPRAGDEARQELGDRRRLGQAGVAFLARDGDQLEPPGLHWRQRREHSVEQHVGLAGHHVHDRLRAAAPGDVLPLDAVAVGERESRQVRRARRARGVVERPGTFLRERDELRHRGHRHVRVHAQQVRRVGNVRDRGEVRDAVGRLGIEHGNDHQRADVAQHQGVAVGRGLGEQLESDSTRRARPALDDHLLRPFLGELGTDQPRQDVGSATRRERHDDADRLHREILGVGAGAESNRRAGEQAA